MNLPAFILGLLLPLSVLGANTPTGLSSPILTNFWPRDFDINIARPNTELIKLNLNSQQFDNGGSTITITNLGNVTGGTNIFNTVYVTNITYTSNLFVTNITANTTYTSNLFVTNITANTIITTNIFVTNVFNTFLVTSNIVAGNVQGTPPHLSYFWPDNFSLTDSIVTQNTNDNNGITVNGTGDGNVTLGGTNYPSIWFGSAVPLQLFRTNEYAINFQTSDVANRSELWFSNPNTSDGAIVGLSGGGAIISGTTVNTYSANGNAIYQFKTYIQPNTPMSLEIGKQELPFSNIVTHATNYLYGYQQGVDDPSTITNTLNFSRGAFYHTGTNAWNAIFFGSESSGIAGPPRPFAFTNAPVMMPYVTKTEKTALSAINGMVVYQTDNTPGFRVYVGGTWYMLPLVADP